MVKDENVTAQDLKDLLSMNCNEVELERFKNTHELDTAVTLSGLRFRANFYKTITGPAAVLRRVESVIPDIEFPRQWCINARDKIASVVGDINNIFVSADSIEWRD